jgi:hypothetical protein
MEINPQFIKRMARAIAMVQPEEITCGECFEHVDKFVEMELAGKNASEAMPLVKNHLEICPYCKEEYEALYKAVKALAEK